MLPLGQRIAFAVFAVAMLVLSARGFWRLYRRVVRGRADADGRFADKLARGWYALRTTLLQERVFRRRVVLSVFHSFIFYAFVLYLLVNAVDAAEGYVGLRAVGPMWMRALYDTLTDAFSVLAIVGVLAFVLRRWVLGARRDFRFNALTTLQPAVRDGYIARDSAIVSGFILLHIGSRVVGNAARLAMEGVGSADARWEPFGRWLAPLFAGPHALAWRVFGYWGALGSVLAFGVYFPYSKHMHIFAAPVKYFFRRDAGSGVLPAATIDLEAAELEVGAAKLADLSWPRMLDAYACIQCNRCQDVCPASATGKALSPAALEINKRMALNAIAGEVSAFALTGQAAFERGESAGPGLLEAVISPEAVWACTTCGACMEVCPTGDEQMLDIVDMRRNLVMAEGAFPAQLGAAFRGMERASNPWGLAREKRMAWADGLRVPTVEEVPDPEVLYWVGCAASYDAGAQKTARAVVQLLTEAGVSFAVLGKRECCTGDSARRAGNELLYQQMAGEAIRVLHEAKPRTVLASCPHCVNTIAKEYPQFGGNFHVEHHTEYLARLVDEGRLTPLASGNAVTFHDPCYLGRHRGTYEEPRALLRVLSAEVVEMPRAKSNAFCCGAGGAQFWKEEERGTERIADNRYAEAARTLGASEAGEKVLAVGCPFCKSMLGSTTAAGGEDAVAVRDVAELLWEGVLRANAVEPAAEVAERARELSVPVALATPDLPPTPLAVSEPTVVAAASAQKDEVSAAAVEVAVAAAAPSVPTVERKKWAPPGKAKAATPQGSAVAGRAEAGEVVTVAGSAQLMEEQVPAPRKKWAPKLAAQPLPVAAQQQTPVVPAKPETAEADVTEAVQGAASAEATTVVVKTEEPGGGTPQRKKWSPRAAATPTTEPSAPQDDAHRQDTEEDSGPVAVDAVAASAAGEEMESRKESEGEQVAPARKKWQPKKS